MEEPFNEGAAQVRRLVQRDRQELLGNATDILDKYKTEFGDGAEEAAAAAASPAAVAAAPSSSAAPAAPAAPSSSSSPFAPSSSGAASPFAAGGATAASPFGSAGAASPFGGAAPARPSRLASLEPKGLTPDMSPDPIVAPPKDTRSWLARITLTQVVSLARARRPCLWLPFHRALPSHRSIVCCWLQHGHPTASAVSDCLEPATLALHVGASPPAIFGPQHALTHATCRPTPSPRSCS